MNKIQRWIEGLKNLTPTQQLHSQMVGHLGSAFGIAFALVFLVSRGMWYFAIFLLFTIFLQIVSYIGIRQQYIAALQMENMLKQQEQTQVQELNQEVKKEDG